MIQQNALLPVDIRIGGFQVFAGFLDVAAAGGGEGDDGLVFKIVRLHEDSADETRADGFFVTIIHTISKTTKKKWKEKCEE